VSQISRLQHYDLWCDYFLCRFKPALYSIALTPPVNGRYRIGETNGRAPAPLPMGLSTKMLDPDTNECYLFHGLNASLADVIAHEGFDERVSNLNAMFGCRCPPPAASPYYPSPPKKTSSKGGIYFADTSSLSAGFCHSEHCEQVGEVYR